jgi:hypothetical protein
MVADENKITRFRPVITRLAETGLVARVARQKNTSCFPDDSLNQGRTVYTGSSGSPQPVWNAEPSAAALGEMLGGASPRRR